MARKDQGIVSLDRECIRKKKPSPALSVDFSVDDSGKKKDGRAAAANNT